MAERVETTGLGFGGRDRLPFGDVLVGPCLFVLKPNLQAFQRIRRKYTFKPLEAVMENVFAVCCI